MECDLKALRYFIKVVEVGSISQAANELGLTQPGLSRLMRQFEEQTGWPLFERGPRSLSITREGEVVAREGRAILKRVKLGWTRMKHEIEGGEIRLGFAPSLGRGLLERAMSCFSQRHPRVRLNLADCATQEMWRGLREGTLDLVLEVATSDPDFQWQPLRQKELRIAIPDDDALSKRRKVKPSDLHDRRLLLLSRAEYPGYWEQVTHYFNAHAINARIAGEFDGIESLSLGLTAGLGVALVAEGSALGGRVRTVQLDPPPNPICVAVGWLAKRKLEPWTEDFIAELKLAAASPS